MAVERFMVGHANIQDIPDRRLSALLGRVKEALRERIGPDFRFILFGSYARGDAGPDSDVDLLIILPDAANTFSVREAARDAVYGFALESQYVFSAMVVSESQACEYSGFLAFGAVEREGVPI